MTIVQASSCSIVVPVYNSRDTLAELTQRLSMVLPGVTAQYELILVNDGSKDGSWQEICRLSHLYNWVHGFNLMRNYGQHNALLCGTRAAQYDIIVTMDDDLQHPPEEIPILLNKLTEGFDVVYGIPRKLPHTTWRNVFSRLTKKVLASVMGISTVRDIGSFRAFRSRLKQAFTAYQSPGVILDVLLSWGTNRFANVPVDEAPREHGSSNYNFMALAVQALLILTGFSTIPLRIAIWLGFLFMVFGIIIFLYVFIATLSAGSIPGFPFLASIVSIFSGVQLFALGIFGEYLARIFDRSMERPAYVIGEITGVIKD